ncbi:MAG: LamG domain-containing protein, partial [Phycisphaerales bacterium]|nr:LamG domain-containing protein [Phycisphaerales bacterium]
MASVFPVCWRLTFVLIIGLASRVVAQPLPPDVIAYWPFDEGAGVFVHDVSGYGNNVTRSGAGWVAGVSGTALEFVGTDILRFVPASFDNPVTDELTIAASVYWYGEHPGTYSLNSYILDARTWAGGYRGFILFIAPDGDVVFRLIQAGGAVESIRSNTSVQPGVWTHVAAVYDGPHEAFRIYIDGLPDAAVATTATYRDTIISGAIGNNLWAPGDSQWAPLNGVLDDLYVFAAALDDERIHGLFDCNDNGIVDACDVDCGAPGGACDVAGCGQ